MNVDTASIATPGKFLRKWHTEHPGTREDKLYLSGDSVEDMIHSALKARFDREFRLYQGDGIWYCPPVADAREILDLSALDRDRWLQDEHDCDDFAWRLKAVFCEAAYADGIRRPAHCMGIVWGMLPGPHAINWIITQDRITGSIPPTPTISQPTLYFIEPQTDLIYLPRPDDKGIWFMAA